MRDWMIPDNLMSSEEIDRVVDKKTRKLEKLHALGYFSAESITFWERMRRRIRYYFRSKTEKG